MDKYNQKWVLVMCLWLSPKWAMTLGQTTFYSESEVYVKTRPHWVRHEQKHKEQWAKEGWKFLLKYIYFSCRYGYKNNPYEIEAREAAK